MGTIPDPIAGLTIGRGASTGDPLCCFSFFFSLLASVFSDCSFGVVSCGGVAAGCAGFAGAMGSVAGEGLGGGVSCAAADITRHRQHPPARQTHIKIKTHTVLSFLIGSIRRQLARTSMSIPGD